MIIQTRKQSRVVEQKIYYKPADDIKISYSHKPIEESYSHRQPILELENQKRFSDYKDQQTNISKWQTKSDMSKSRLSQMNQQLQERTNYYAKHGKYDSRWNQQHVQRFGTGSRASRREESAPVFMRSSGVQYPNHLRQQLQHEPRHQTYQFVTPAYQIQSNVYPVSPLESQTYTHTYSPHQAIPSSQPTLSPTNSWHSSKDQSKFYDLAQPSDALRYHANVAKQVAKGQARQVKQQIKQNVRDNVKQTFGHQNYYLMKNVKDGVGQLADNALEGVKENVRVVADTAKVAKDVVKEGARDAKDQVKEGTKQAVKTAVGPENFNLMKYIKDATGQIAKNVFGISLDANPKAQPQRVSATSTVNKSPSLNQVSPIQYSQRSFSQAPSEQFGFFWIYGLILIGFFLVIFQALK